MKRVSAIAVTGKNVTLVCTWTGDLGSTSVVHVVEVENVSYIMLYPTTHYVYYIIVVSEVKTVSSFDFALVIIAFICII